MTVTTADVVKAMSNEPNNSTLGWDVVVNYSQTELNALLQESYKTNPHDHLTELSLDVSITDIDLNVAVIKFDLQLGAPLIQFKGDGTRPYCSLTIPVDGGYSKTPTAQLDIPSGGYAIELSNLEMAAISGSTAASIASNKPFNFPPQGSDTAAVTIDLPTSCDVVAKLNVVDSSKNNRQIDAHRSELEGRILDFFKNTDNVTSIQYHLASVNSDSTTEDGFVDLRPKSFRFAVYHSDASATTILSLFIHVSDSDNTGTQIDLQQKWNALWISLYNTVPPIPETHTASIIFNSTMMHDSVIAPAFKKAGVDANAPTFSPGQGLLYRIRTHLHVHRDAWEEGDFHTSEVSVNLDDDANALCLTLGQHGDSHAQASGSISWQFSYSFEYGQWVPSSDHWGKEDRAGRATVSNSLTKSTAFSETLSDYNLEMSLSISKGDWSKPVVKQTDGGLFFYIFGGTVPDWVLSTIPDAPDFKLVMGSLRFFLTTNLLMPGSKVISIDTSSDGGLRIPHDYYLVGSIVKLST